MLTLESFLDKQRLAVEDLEKRTSIAYWNASISGSKEDELLAASLVTQLQSLYADPAKLDFLLSIEEPTDIDLRRQRKLLIDAFKAHQSSPEIIADLATREMEIESLFANFRATFEGKTCTDNELREIFKSCNDSELRRQAWEASKQIGAASSATILELIRLRNVEAKRRGYSNNYSKRI